MRDNDNVYIPEEDYQRLAKYALRDDDLLISVVGTLGAVAIVSPQVLPAIFSCKSTVYRTQLLNPYYLLAYLNTKYGQGLLLRRTRGTVQTGLNIGDLNSVQVFLPSPQFQEMIAAIIKTAYTKLEESKRLYAAAESALLEALGLQNIDLSDSLFNIQRFSSVQQSDRLDSEHYNQKYERLENMLKSYPLGYKTIGHLCLPPTNGAEVREYVETGTPYLRVGDLRQLEISEDTVVYIADEAADAVREKVALKTGDVLISRSGSLGLSCVVTEKWQNAITSSHLIRLRIGNNAIDPYYLALFMNTPAGVEQVRKRSNGGIQPEINHPSLKNIIVPLLSKDSQLQIREMVIASHQTRQESKRLLESARRAVENAIEGS